MKNQEIKFKNNNSNYSIFIGKNALKILPNKIRSLCPRTKKIALVVDKKVPTKFKTILKKNLKKYEVLFIPFKANEKNKSIDTVNNYLKILLSKNSEKETLTINMIVKLKPTFIFTCSFPKLNGIILFGSAFCECIYFLSFI